MVPGKATRSYGIQVAKLAGLPGPVVHRAKEILAQYETSEPRHAGMMDSEPPSRLVAEPRPEYHPKVVSTFQQEGGDSLPQAIFHALLNLDIEAMTPVEALTKLYELKKKAEGR